MKNNMVLLLFFLFPNLAMAEKEHFEDFEDVVGIVFHESYCEPLSESLNDVRLSYLNAIRQKGYTLVDLCLPTQTAAEIKSQLAAKAEAMQLDWGSIKGINLFGPVLETLAHPSLRFTDAPALPTAVELMFDDFSYSHADSFLSDIQANIATPSKGRWVSHQLESEKSRENIVAYFSELEKELVLPGELQRGDEYIKNLTRLLRNQEQMHFFFYRNPNIILPVFFAGLCTIFGYFYIATPKVYPRQNKEAIQKKALSGLYLKVIFGYIAVYGGALGGVWMLDNQFGRTLRNDDVHWKLLLVRVRLTSDGLTKLPPTQESLDSRLVSFLKLFF